MEEFGGEYDNFEDGYGAYGETVADAEIKNGDNSIPQKRKYVYRYL